MTWKILTDDGIVIYRSTIRALGDTPIATYGGEDETQNIIYVKGRLESDNPYETLATMPTVEPESLIGRQFLLPGRDKEDEPFYQAYVKRIIKYKDENDNKVENLRALIKVDVGTKKIEEIITYTSLLDYIQGTQEEDSDEPTVEQHERKLVAIMAHDGPYSQRSKCYKGGKYNLKLQWDDGAITVEPLSNIAKVYPTVCAAYAKRHKLFNTDGWKFIKA